MCDVTPQILSARVFAADGTTPVPGKGPLVQGTDYTFSYAGAPTCELTLTMLTPAGVDRPGERLIITYQTQLDGDSQDGATLTNVAGATQWFNDDEQQSRPHHLHAHADRRHAGRRRSRGRPHLRRWRCTATSSRRRSRISTTGVSPIATAAPGETAPLHAAPPGHRRPARRPALRRRSRRAERHARCSCRARSRVVGTSRPARLEHRTRTAARTAPADPRHRQHRRARQQPGRGPVRHHAGVGRSPTARSS